MRTALNLAMLATITVATGASADPAIQKFGIEEPGYSESLEITRGPGGLHAALGVGVHGCAGEVKGPVTRGSGGALLMSAADDGNECKLSIVIHGQTAKVTELGCSYWHGASCEFTGTLHATR